MRQFHLDMLRWYSRPVIRLYGTEALIDTGAEIPVFSLSKESLEHLFRAKMVLGNGSVRGFGGDFSGDVYQLENFYLGDLTYPGMKVLVPHDLTNGFFRIILSASMFHGLSCNIDFSKHRLTVQIPDGESLSRDIRVLDKEGKEHILVSE